MNDFYFVTDTTVTLRLLEFRPPVRDVAVAPATSSRRPSGRPAAEDDAFDVRDFAPRWWPAEPPADDE